MTDQRSLGKAVARASGLLSSARVATDAARYRLDTLIARHGAHAAVRVIVPERSLLALFRP